MIGIIWSWWWFYFEFDLKEPCRLIMAWFLGLPALNEARAARRSYWRSRSLFWRFGDHGHFFGDLAITVTFLVRSLPCRWWPPWPKEVKKIHVSFRSVTVCAGSYSRIDVFRRHKVEECSHDIWWNHPLSQRFDVWTVFQYFNNSIGGKVTSPVSTNDKVTHDPTSPK